MENDHDDDNDNVSGAVSTCWSPGQRDTDCPSNGLCCFDGCANTCGDAPRGKERETEGDIESERDKKTER